MTMFPVVGAMNVGGDHVYESAPDTWIEVEVPAQIVTVSGITGAGGVKKTFTNTSALNEQPVGEITVTSYVVGSVGVAIGVALVGSSKLVVGLQA